MSDLVPIEDVETFLGSDQYPSEKLPAWLSGLSAYIRRYVDRPIETESVQETLDGNGETTILVSKRPVLSVTKVTIDGGGDVSGDIEFYEEGLIYYDGGFTVGRKNVVVGYTAGHGGSVPNDLQLAVCLILQRMSQASRSEQAGYGEQGLTSPESWPVSAREIIDSYRSKL